jgi:hypothetical protein
MTITVRLDARSLKQLGQLATDHVGECVVVRWQPIGNQGHRRAAVYFRYRDAARAFARLARSNGFLATDPDRTYYRLNDRGDPISHPYEPVAYQGFRVLALVQPDPRNPNGWRPAPPYRDQAATRAWGIAPESKRKPRSDYRRQREADAPLEQWLEAEVERELDRITAEVNAWWRGRGYDQDCPEAYLAAVEERKARARTHKRIAAGGPAVSPALRKAVAEGVEQVERAQAKASAYRQRQQQRNRVAADDADVIAELGRWDGTTLSDEAWDVEFGIERESEA